MGANLSDQAIRASHVDVPAHVAQREFADETVALNLETGRYHGLNSTASRMLCTSGAARCTSLARASWPAWG